MGNIVQSTTSLDWVECATMCDILERCTAFNFFGPSSDPDLAYSCVLFSACEERVPCSDCVIGTGQDKCTCSIGYSDNTGDAIGVVQDVSEELSCKSLCWEEANCTHYTYYKTNDLDTPEICVLHSGQNNDGMTKCDNCASGPAYCSTMEKCQISVLTDGDTNQYVFATSSRNATLIAKEKDCYVEIRALAVGGGGRGPTGYGGGAGSGQVNITSLVMKAGDVLALTVGAQGEPSSVQKDGEVVLLADAGQNYDRENGGDGYSGGGGYDESGVGGAGGQDGSDGEDTPSGKGGHGSGLKLGELNMTRFTLSPGMGGVGTSTYGGGGAGGVVVNGQKPPGGSEWDGEGFGAGSFVGAKRSGCVLIEV